MRRVVVTGMGVVAPNGNNLPEFKNAIINGRSGIRFLKELKEHNFACQVAGIPAEINEALLEPYFSKSTFKGLKGLSIKYASLATIEAYQNAGLSINPEETDWDTGCIYGHAVGDFLVLKGIIDNVELKRPRKMGSRYVAQGMNSGPCAHLAQVFGLGNQVMSNASACSTGTESIIMAFHKIRNGSAKRMIAGSCESANKFTWGAFDAMRVMNARSNDQPHLASRPMSASANGFVPGAGAATLILEDLETAVNRGATIYAEILGGAINCGGQRNGGTMTAPNNEGVQRCIHQALQEAKTKGNDIDLIAGHLTATYADKVEVKNWLAALGRSKDNFPYINSLKSMIGHCVGAAGSIECIATILQIHNNFVHPSINSEDLHPEIEEMIDAKCIPSQKIDTKIDIAIKANFGFGDVNSCIVISKYKEQIF